MPTIFLHLGKFRPAKVGKFQPAETGEYSTGVDTASASASMTHGSPTSSRPKAGRCCVFLDRTCIETQPTVSHNSRMHLVCKNHDEISLNKGATRPSTGTKRRIRRTSVVKDGWPGLERRVFGHPKLNPPVNKRFLSTGETGEFASENVGFGLNPGVERAPPHDLSSNRRERRNARKPAECWGYGRRGPRAMLSTIQAIGVGAERLWLPSLNPPRSFSGRRFRDRVRRFV